MIKVEMGRACSLDGMRNTRVSVRKPEGRRSGGSPRHRWENNIKWIRGK
jgi:hypothetical protein